MLKIIKIHGNQWRSMKINENLGFSLKINEKHRKTWMVAESGHYSNNTKAQQITQKL